VTDIDEPDMSQVIAELAGDQLRSPNLFDQIRKDRALSLLQQCQEYDIAPPTTLIDLIAAYIGDDRRNLVGKGYESKYILQVLASKYGVSPFNYRKLVIAAEFEAEHPVDPTGNKPSTAKISHIAEVADISRATVRGYQLKESYREMVTRFRAELAESGSSP
jgi:hypothetical protein